MKKALVSAALVWVGTAALLAAFDRIFGDSDWPATARSHRRGARPARLRGRRR